MQILKEWEKKEGTQCKPGIHNQRGTVGGDISLTCETRGNKYWSKGEARGRMLILIGRKINGREISDRYSLLPDFTLHIKNLTLSDSGIYSCNADSVVNLTVTPLQDKTPPTTPTTTTPPTTTPTTTPTTVIIVTLVCVLAGVVLIIIIFIALWRCLPTKTQKNQTEVSSSIPNTQPPKDWVEVYYTIQPDNVTPADIHQTQC
ncbi:hepatitis A virus cellular receptor 1 homolog [Trichomycterus rosablanca]|uniref:hepatitis A virus cellular receptor 1 homolog n=1 Tax=Trichomycterus rosablanca TaxID=2290929 RepID=UPI002F355016